VQPYVPEYRVPFFRALRQDLSSVGVALAVAAAGADSVATLRSDDFTSTSSDLTLREISLSLGHRTLLYRSLRPAVTKFRPDLVVVEQAIKNLETWPLILGSSLGSGPRVAMWGQGRSYSTGQSRLAAATKQWLTRRSDWFFSYTEAGAAHVIAGGFPSERVTVLRNSTDTTELRRDLLSISESDVWDFQSRWGLTPGRVGLFMGGVDEHKGIPFLLDSAKRIAELLPGFRLMIAGSGSLADTVKKADRVGGSIVYLSRVSGLEKALALAAADVLLVPEWVGLVAVDALAAGKPVVTTDHSSHSPEVEYLASGETALFARHDVESYSRAAAQLLLDVKELDRMSLAARLAGDAFSIEAMAGAFARGVVSWASSR
jgi:glycosyltransferase involved in cell wall biosynthesis